MTEQVYILLGEFQYEGNTILKVYSDELVATRMINKIKKWKSIYDKCLPSEKQLLQEKFPLQGDNYYYDSYSLQAYEVNND